MNILILNSAKAWGGNEKWSLMAARGLSASHRVYIAYRSEVYGERFEFPKFKLPFYAEIDPLTIAKLVWIVQKYQIDILMPTKRKDYVLAGIAAQMTGKQNILRLGIVRDLHNRWVNKLVYHQLAGGIIVNAKEIKEVLLRSKFMKPENIRLIYNGLDLQQLNDLAKKESFTKPGKFLVSSMGLLIGRKGFDVLLKGFAHFLRLTGAGDASLLIIGEGIERENLEKLARELGIQNQVIFTGFLENPYPVLAQSDVFVMTSKNEGFANALLEAIACGCAPITTKAGGVEEILQHKKSALIIEYDEPERLGESIQELYQNSSLRQSLSQQAKKVVESTFSIGRMNRQIEEFFQDRIQKNKVVS